MDNFSVEGKDYLLLRGHLKPASTIIAVGGGKGGVGKSFVSSSLAIFLSQLGYETVLIDLDLGAANLHTCLGEGLPQLGINEFIHDPKINLKDTQSATRFAHLKLISGASENVDAANITDDQRSRLMSAIYRLPADVTILDLSAGTHEATLDFFLMATRKIVVFTPEPSSMENAYRFMKSAFYRRMRRFEFQLQLKDAVAELMNNRLKYGIKSPADLTRAICQNYPEAGARLSSVLGELNFEIVLNQIRSSRDVDLGGSIQTVSNRYFGVPTAFLGHLEYDNAVWQSLRKRRHLLIEYPHTRLYAQLMAISRRLAAEKIQRAVV